MSKPKFNPARYNGYTDNQKKYIGIGYRAAIADIGLRDEVLAFAQLMEQKLRKHDARRGRTGWKQANRSYLRELLRDETLELDEALINGADPDGIGSETADIGNMAMMIADVSGALK